MANENSMQLEAERTAEDLKDKAADVADDVQDKAGGMAAKAGDVAGDVKDKAGQVAGDVKDKADAVAGEVAAKADAARGAAADGLGQMAQTVREKSPETGMAADLAMPVADALEKSSVYLQELDLADVRSDLEGLIRRHPMEALLVGLGIGFLVARAARS